MTATLGVGGTNTPLFATTSKSTGKWTFSVGVVSPNLNLIGVGFATSGTPTSNYRLGANATDEAWSTDTGSVFIQFNVKGTGETYGSGDTAWVAVDIDNKLVWVRKNTGNWNNNGAANPDTGANGFDISALPSFTLRAAASFNALNDALTINFIGVSGLSSFNTWDTAPGGGGTGGGLLLFGGSVGWTPLLGAAAAWKAGNAIRRNATLARRRLLTGKW